MAYVTGELNFLLYLILVNLNSPTCLLPKPLGSVVSTRDNVSLASFVTTCAVSKEGLPGKREERKR